MILKILEKIFSGFLEGDHHHFHLLSWLLSLKSTILRLVRQFWSWQRSSLASWKEIFPIMILIFTFHPQNHQYCGYTFLDKGGQGAWWLERQAFQVNNELITKVQNSEYVLHLLSNMSSDSGGHTVTICLVCSFNQTLSWKDILWQSVTVCDILWQSISCHQTVSGEDTLRLSAHSTAVCHYQLGWAWTVFKNIHVQLNPWHELKFCIACKFDISIRSHIKCTTIDPAFCF